MSKRVKAKKAPEKRVTKAEAEELLIHGDRPEPVPAYPVKLIASGSSSTLDFEELERAGPVTLTEDLRERTERVEGLLSLAKTLPRGTFSRQELPLRRFRAFIAAGELFLRNLSFFENLAFLEAGLARYLGDEKKRKSCDSAEAALLGLRCKLARLLPTLEKLYSSRWVGRGRKANSFYDWALLLADKIYRDAGGTGKIIHRPSSWKKINGKYAEMPDRWEGGSIHFVVELLKQAGYDDLRCSASVGQAIYKLSKRSRKIRNKQKTA